MKKPYRDLCRRQRDRTKLNPFVFSSPSGPSIQLFSPFACRRHRPVATCWCRPPCRYPDHLLTFCTSLSSPDVASSGVGEKLNAMGVPAGTSLFIACSDKFGSEDVGRHVRLSNTGVSYLNTNFSILVVLDAKTVLLATGAGINLVLPIAATFTTLAGAGPGPSSNPSAYVPFSITVGKAASVDFDAFPTNTGFTDNSNDIGDSFTLGTSNGKVLPNQIPVDGSAFTMGCDSAADCRQALGFTVDIVTTDVPLGASPFSFPAMVTKRVHVRCVQVGASTVIVPAAYSARLKQSTSGATRMSVRFIRANQAGATNLSGAPNVTNIAGGRAELGFTTFPQL